MVKCLKARGFRSGFKSLQTGNYLSHVKYCLPSLYTTMIRIYNPLPLFPPPRAAPFVASFAALGPKRIILKNRSSQRKTVTKSWKFPHHFVITSPWRHRWARIFFRGDGGGLWPAIPQFFTFHFWTFHAMPIVLRLSILFFGED